jgi:hypothetical protein
MAYLKKRLFGGVRLKREEQIQSFLQRSRSQRFPVLFHIVEFYSINDGFLTYTAASIKSRAARGHAPKALRIRTLTAQTDKWYGATQ